MSVSHGVLPPIFFWFACNQMQSESCSLHQLTMPCSTFLSLESCYLHWIQTSPPKDKQWWVTLLQNGCILQNLKNPCCHYLTQCPSAHIYPHHTHTTDKECWSCFPHCSHSYSSFFGFGVDGIVANTGKCRFYYQVWSSPNKLWLPSLITLQWNQWVI